MNVLFAASEAVPFVKTGGLADVIGSLPKELIRQGADVRVILPKYEGIPQSYSDQMEQVTSFYISLGWRSLYCGVFRLELDGVTFYFIDNEFYFKRSGLYGYGDDAERYIFFCRAVLEALPYLDFQPQIIHCHDWQTGLIPFCLRVKYGHHEAYSRIRTVFTIHNLRYQGVFSRDLMKDLLGVGDEHFAIDGLDFYGSGNCMKGGIVHSDLITTVSQTYAKEIQTWEFGEQLDGVLSKRKSDLLGIVNGIDYSEYDPMTDPHIAAHYRSSLPKKRKNKAQLQELAGLPIRDDVPVIGIVSRLVQQKGFDLIEHVMDRILELDVQLVVLGTGDAKYEHLFGSRGYEHPDKLYAYLGFKDSLARQIYAGSDLFLMPSQFEPCGIGQLLALRYRTVPIVRETGGLKDTVQPFNVYTGEGTGFSFSYYNAADMLFTIERAIGFYHQPEHWSQIIANISKQDFSWKQSARTYLEQYNRLVL